MGVVKNVCSQSGHSTLKLTLCQECTDGVSKFFNTGANSGEQKVSSMIFGWIGQKWA